MALGVIAHGPQEIGNGLATGRQDSPEQQHEEPIVGRCGKSWLKYAQYWHRKRWDLHALGLSWCAVSLVVHRRPLLHHEKMPFSTPKRAKVELRNMQEIDYQELL
jgi:hypothetical protein